MEREYNLILDIVYSFVWVCDILLLTANIYSLYGRMILNKSTASREYPGGSDTKNFIFHSFTFGFNFFP